MTFNVFDSSLQVTVSLGKIRLQHVLHQTLRVGIERRGEFYFSFQDFLVNQHGVLVVEGVDSGVHFVEEHAEGPPVDGLAMAFIQQDFGREVLGGSAQSVSSALTVLGEAEVRQFQIPGFIDQNILGFQISVNDVLRVQVLEHQAHLCGVETKIRIN